MTGFSCSAGFEKLRVTDDHSVSEDDLCQIIKCGLLLGYIKKAKYK